MNAFGNVSSKQKKSIFEGIHKEGIFSDIPRSCPDAVLKYKLMRSAASSSTPSFLATAFLRSLISASEWRLNSFRSFLSSTRIVTQNFIIVSKSWPSNRTIQDSSLISCTLWLMQIFCLKSLKSKINNRKCKQTAK